MRYPSFTEVSVTDNELIANFSISQDLDWFKGHFNTIAIVPGVAQMSFVAELSRRYFNYDPEKYIKSVNVLKFTYPLKNGANAQIVINRNTEKSVMTFKIKDLDDESKVYSSGKIFLDCN